MRGEFQEDRDDTGEGSYDFDWALLEERLGETSSEAVRSEVQQKLALALGSILDWLMAIRPLKRRWALRSIGLRTVAMAWVVNPERLNGDSIRSVAKQLGFTAANISPLTADFSRKFGGITNGFQNKHDWRHEK